MTERTVLGQHQMSQEWGSCIATKGPPFQSDPIAVWKQKCRPHTCLPMVCQLAEWLLKESNWRRRSRKGRTL